jgi:hypothetical protein
VKAAFVPAKSAGARLTDVQVRSLVPWLVPAFVGPAVALIVYVSIAVFVFDQWDPKFGVEPASSLLMF